MSLANRIALWFIAVGVTLRAIFFHYSQNNGGDAFARAAVTAQWLQHPSFSLDFGGPRWPPLHFWLMAFVTLFVPDVQLACRLLSLAAGIVSLWLLWRLTLRLYGEWPATFAVATLAVCSLHIGYGTASSSEAVLVAFVLAGLLGVFTYRSIGKYLPLVAGAICFTAAAAIRFEAWILIFALGLVFLFDFRSEMPQDKYWKGLFAFGFTSGAWPIFWTARSYLMTGHLFAGLADNHASIPAQLAVNPGHGALYELALFPGVILLTLTPFALTGALYGLWLSIRDRKRLDFALPVLFLALFQLMTIATHGTLALARYTLLVATLTIVLAGYGLAVLIERFFSSKREVFAVGVLTVVLLANLTFIVLLSENRSPFEDKFRSISPLMQFPVHVEEVGKILRPRLEKKDRVLIDNYNEEPNILGAAIGLPLLAKDRGLFASDRTGDDPFPYLREQKPRFAVLSDRGLMGSKLAMPEGCPATWELRQFQFRCLFENDIYRVYEIHYYE